MQDHIQQKNDAQNRVLTYVKPAIKAYNIAMIHHALGPAVGFSGGRADDEESLLFED